MRSAFSCQANCTFFGPGATVQRLYDPTGLWHAYSAKSCHYLKAIFSVDSEMTCCLSRIVATLRSVGRDVSVLLLARLLKTIQSEFLNCVNCVIVSFVHRAELKHAQHFVKLSVIFVCKFHCREAEALSTDSKDMEKKACKTGQDDTTCDGCAF